MRDISKRGTLYIKEPLPLLEKKRVAMENLERTQYSWPDVKGWRQNSAATGCNWDWLQRFANGANITFLI